MCNQTRYNPNVPILHVRSVPDDLYQELEKQARQSNRSLSAEVVDLLDAALREKRVRRQHGKALADIRRRRFPLRKGARTIDLLKIDRRR